jgi:hypothetical protein
MTGTTPTVLSQLRDEVGIDIDLSENRGGSAGGHGGGEGHHSSAARPAIPRLFRALALLKYAVADHASLTGPTAIGDSVGADVLERRDVGGQNAAHGGGHGGSHGLHGRGGGGRTNAHRAAARP